MSARTPKRPIVPALVAVVAALLAITAVVVPRGSGGSSEPQEPAVGAQAADAAPQRTMARRLPGDPMSRGAADAPVVMVSYSEFQCPFCGRFARKTEPELIKKYVDAGTLRIEWRDFPYLGDESLAAAKAGRAAAEQDMFWAFHDALYADQQAPNSGQLTPGFLASTAARAGLDTARFRRALQQGDGAEQVQRDFSEGQSIGVTGTPAFLINGRPIMGAQPTEVFEQAIEQAAAAAR